MEVRAYGELEPFTTKDGSTIREYLHTQAQSLAEAVLASGQATERHYHGRSEEIYLLLAGGGRMEVDGAVREVGPGDAVLIPPVPGTSSWPGSRGRGFCAAVRRPTATTTPSSPNRASRRD